REFGPRQIPINQFKKRVGEQIGEEWILKRSSSRKMRHLMFDHNYWKTFAHRRLATPQGNPGCVSIFGREAAVKNKPARKANHDYLARQLDAETRTVSIDGDRRIDLWTQKPSSENH